MTVPIRGPVPPRTHDSPLRVLRGVGGIGESRRWAPAVTGGVERPPGWTAPGSQPGPGASCAGCLAAVETGSQGGEGSCPGDATVNGRWKQRWPWASQLAPTCLAVGQPRTSVPLSRAQPPRCASRGSWEVKPSRSGVETCWGAAPEVWRQRGLIAPSPTRRWARGTQVGAAVLVNTVPLVPART